MARTSVWKDPVRLAQAAVLFRTAWERRDARLVAHSAGRHHLCRPQDDCQQQDKAVAS